MAVLLLGCASPSQCAETEVFRDNNVIMIEKTWPFYPILGLHTGKSICLIVAGTKYCGVKGTAPNYLDIPQIHSIIFVTEGGSYKVTLHVVNMETKKAIHIDGKGTIFGSFIGSSRNPGDKLADYVEKVELNRITLATHGADWKQVTVLNLQTESIEKEDNFTYDKDGKEIEHTVRSY